MSRPSYQEPNSGFLYQGGRGIVSRMDTQGCSLVHVHPMSLDKHGMG